MTTPDTPSSRLLARADLLLLIRDLLTAPVQSFGHADRHIEAEDLRELLAVAGLDPSSAPLAQALVDTAGFPRLNPAEWIAERNRLFEGPVLCPINESAYVRRDKGAILGDLCGFYRAFGFDPAQGTGEKADHLAIELEFLAVLLVMQQQAPTPGQAQVASDAVAAYCRDHLGEWIPLFCLRLGQLADIAPHRAAGTLLQSLWSAIATELGLPIESSSEPPEMDGGTPYSCGMEELEAHCCDTSERPSVCLPTSSTCDIV